MKKLPILIALILALAAGRAGAQVQLIDLTTPHTNIVVSSALLTVPGLFTNLPYTASNHWSITIGDNPNTVGTKINANFNYVSNQLFILAVLPNQINTNLASLVSALSNQVWLATGTNAATVARIGTVGTSLTNLVASTGLDLTNRLDAIQSPGSSGSSTVLKSLSPSGTTWYLHVDNSGVLTVTGSP